MFEWITNVIRDLGYIGVAVLALLENVFPPVPSEVVIPLAGFVAARGDLRIGGVILVATMGSLAGAALWYGVGRRIGERRLRAWVNRSGKWLTISERDVDRSQQWFERRGRLAVFAGRLVPGVRTFVSLPAGFTRMPIGSFLLFSALGTATWTAALAYAGVMLRSNYELVAGYVNVASYVLLVLLGVTIVRRYIRCWRRHTARAAATTP